jgi:hypothetical protein
MTDHRRPRPSPAMILALFALFVSLSGAAYAAGSIDTGDIKDGAVTTPQLHDGAVTQAKVRLNASNGSKVIDNALKGADIKESTLGQVPDALTATLGGIGRSSYGGGCNPDSTIA